MNNNRIFKFKLKIKSTIFIYIFINVELHMCTSWYYHQLQDVSYNHFSIAASKRWLSNMCYIHTYTMPSKDPLWQNKRRWDYIYSTFVHYYNSFNRVVAIYRQMDFEDLPDWTWYVFSMKFIQKKHRRKQYHDPSYFRDNRRFIKLI